MTRVHTDLVLSVAEYCVLGVSMNVIAYIRKTFSNAASWKWAENNINLIYQLLLLYISSAHLLLVIPTGEEYLIFFG
jgi:hypothetical protein